MPDFVYFPTANNIAIHTNERTNVTLPDPCEIFDPNALFLICDAKVASKYLSSITEAELLSVCKATPTSPNMDMR